MLNEMMHRPVVMEAIVDYMRSELSPFEGGLAAIEAYANERGIPIIPHETAKFLDLLCATLQPSQILEIGTAIGFSASLMAQHLSQGGHLTTIDRYPKMFERAKENFKTLGLEDQISLMEGEAADLLPQLEGPYDLIFMDSSKAKYIEFLPECMRLLNQGGLLLIDDVFQGGTVLADESEIPRRVRTIHRRLNELLDTVLPAKNQRSCLLPLGDGVLMIRKESDCPDFIK